MVCQWSAFLVACVTDSHWQIIDKKQEKDAETETATNEATNIQSGFVAAKGSVPIKSGKKRKKKLKI